MSLIHNEQTKLRATYLNWLAIALFAVGGLTPLSAASYASQPARIPYWGIALMSLICSLGSAVLHLWASRKLKELKE